MRSVTIDGSGGTARSEADGEVSGSETDGRPFSFEGDDEPLDDEYDETVPGGPSIGEKNDRQLHADQPVFLAKCSNGEP